MIAPKTDPARRSDARVRIGVAGWSYPDWRGKFYPPSPGAGFSQLRFAAEIFDCLEINGTFYRFPEAETCASWASTVDGLDDFLFTAKLTRDITHGSAGGRKEDRRSARPPPPEKALELCARFREGIAPLAESERLGAVLAQFPWFFEDSIASRELLAAIAQGLRPLPVAVEVRHISFLVGGEGGPLRFFEREGLDFVNIDLPRSATAPPLTTVNTGSIGYFRLHGRNDGAWFDSNAGRDEKYDYLYSSSELQEIAKPILRVASRTASTFVVTNNHFEGQAPANALQLIELLTGRRPAVPEFLQRSFPFLSSDSPRGAS